jgi:SulP family sulfate permease
VFGELADLSQETRGFVLYMDGVTVLDAGGLAALNKLIDQCRRTGAEVMIADLQFQPLRTLARAGLKPEPGVSSFYPSLASALETLSSRRSAPQML